MPPSDQINLTVGGTRISPASVKGFDQSYSAQAAVDTGSMQVVVNGIAEAAADTQ